MNHHSRCFFLAVTCMALPVISSAACSQGQEPDSKKSNTVPAAAVKPEAEKEGTLLELGCKSGSPTALRAEVSYTVKRKAGVVTKEFELEVDDATPGTTHTVTLDGAAIGKMVTDAKGDAKLNLLENKTQKLPEGFPEPKAGSVIRIGEIMDLHLFALVKLKELEASIAGPDKLSGKVTFKVEQLGKDVTREFQVKIAGAPAKTVLAVTLGDVHVGDVQVDAAGTGRLQVSSKKAPLPASFPEPEVGSKIRVGDLFAGELRDANTSEKRQQ